MADKSKEQFIAEIIFENDKLISGVRGANSVLDNFEQQSSKVFNQFGKAAIDNIAKVNKQLDAEQAAFKKYADEQAKAFKQVQDQLQKANDIDVGGKLDSIAANGKELVSSFLGAAGQIEQFRLTLTTLTGSASKAEVELAKLRDYANLTQFNLENVTAAGVKLRSFKVDVDRFLPLAGDLASVFDRDIKDAALGLGKALGGSQDGIQILNDSFGITRKDLKEAGAVMKSTGAISQDTAGDIAKLADAIEKVAQKKNFTGAVNAQLATLKANASQAQDAAFNLAAAIGETLAPAFVALSQTATTTINAVASLPRPILALVGGATALATGLAAAGGAALIFNTAIGSVVPLLAKMLPALTGITIGAEGAGAALAFSAAAINPFIAAAVVLGGIGLAAAIGINAMEQSAKTLDSTLTAQSKSFAAVNTGAADFERAIQKATGTTDRFAVSGSSATDQANALKQAFEGLSDIELFRNLTNAGVTLDGLNDQIEASKKRSKEFQSDIRDLANALDVLEKRNANKAKGGDLSESSQFGNDLNAGIDPQAAKKGLATLEEQFGKVDVATEDVVNRIKQLELSLKKGTAFQKGSLEPTRDELKSVDNSLKGVIATSKTKLAALKIKADTGDLERSNKLLQETTGTIISLKNVLSGRGIDVSSLNKIQDALAGAKTTEEREALSGLLDLIKEKGKLEKQGAEISSQAVKKNLDASLEEARSLETTRERIRALQEVLKIEGLTADQKKSVNSEITREQKTLGAELKKASAEKVQQAIFEAQAVEGGAQKQIAALKAVLSQYELEASQRRAILKEIAGLEDQLEKEREKRRKAEADAITSEGQRQQELIIAAIDERIGKLREEADQGKNVQAELVAALEERTAKEVALIEEKTQARVDEADSAKVADEIEKTGQLEIEAARRAGTDAIEDQKKAQDSRIAKLKEERKEALKTAGDEKKARQDVATSTRAASASSSSSQQSSGGQSQNSNIIGQSMEEVFAGINDSFSKDNARARSDEIAAAKAEKQADAAALFQNANPELVARMGEDQVKRAEAIAKIEEDRLQKIADSYDTIQKKISDRQTVAQANVDTGNRLDAASRSSIIDGRPLTSKELDDRLAAFGEPRAKVAKIDTASSFTKKPLSIAEDPAEKKRAADKKASASVEGKSVQAAGANSTRGELLITLVTDGNVKSASLRGGADLDGKNSELQRIGNKFSARVSY